MFKTLAKIALAVAVFAAPAMALPTMPQTAIPDVTTQPLIKIATKRQKAIGRRACRAQYGARLAYVTFSGNRYTCHFRKSTRQLTKKAARNCRKSGLRLLKVNSIRIKGNRSITRFTCVRR